MSTMAFDDRSRPTGSPPGDGAAAGRQRAPVPAQPPADGATVGTPPAVALPKGGGAIRGIGGKFTANPVTGSGSLSVPIFTSPGRSGLGPQLSLSYDSGAGNGPFGFGWQLGLPAITRKTDKSLPRYLDADESDTFILSGAEDLVPVLVQAGGQWQRPAPEQPLVDGVEHRVQRYRSRVEGLFARIERRTKVQPGEAHWRWISKDNVTTLYGRMEKSRIAHPADPTRVFSWLICASYDDKGNAIVYEYLPEDAAGIDRAQAHEQNRRDQSRSANRYLKRIWYGNRTSWLLQQPDRAGPDPAWPDLSGMDWCFEVVFDYGEGHYAELPPDPEGRRLVQAASPALAAWTVRRDPFSSYRADFEVRTYRLCRRLLMFHHFPDALDSQDCLVRLTDLTYTEDPVAPFTTSVTQSGCVHRSGGIYLERSLPPLELGARPSLAALGAGRQQLLDLAGDGQLDLAQFDGPVPGFFERTRDERWEQFTPFVSLPRLAWDDLNLRFLDLTGDGHADVLVTEDEVFTWYRSLAEAGFGPPVEVRIPRDEEAGPRLVGGVDRADLWATDAYSWSNVPFDFWAGDCRRPRRAPPHRNYAWPACGRRPGPRGDGLEPRVLAPCALAAGLRRVAFAGCSGVAELAERLCGAPSGSCVRSASGLGSRCSRWASTSAGATSRRGRCPRSAGGSVPAGRRLLDACRGPARACAACASRSAWQTTSAEVDRRWRGSCGPGAAEDVAALNLPRRPTCESAESEIPTMTIHTMRGLDCQQPGFVRSLEAGRGRDRMPGCCHRPGAGPDSSRRSAWA